LRCVKDEHRLLQSFLLGKEARRDAYVIGKRPRQPRREMKRMPWCPEIKRVMEERQGEHIPFEPMSPPLFFAQIAQERVEKSKQTCNVSGCECTQIKAPRPRAARSSGWWDWRLLPPWLVKMLFCSISTAWVGVMAVPARNKSHMFSALSRAPNRFASLPDSLFLFLQERPRSRRKRRSPRRSRQRRLMVTKMVRAKTTTSSSSASTPSPSLSPQRS
jgi:hypothetical protein